MSAAPTQHSSPQPNLVPYSKKERRPTLENLNMARPDAKNSSVAPEVFSEKEKKQLANASKVWVLAYSSTGGGHTARSFDPMLAAVKRGIIGSGDLICITLPEKWPHDKGAAVNALNKYLDLFKAEQVDVIVKQVDKTITGLYTKTGSSDNSTILSNFVDKAKRKIPSPPIITILDEPAKKEPAEEKPASRIKRQMIEAGFDPNKGNSANSIMKQMVKAGGDPNKFHVLSDMGVYTVKGAIAAGIPASQVIEMGNHVTLLDRNKGGRNLAYLSKVTAEGRAGKIGVIEYNKDINPVGSMSATLNDLSVTPQTQVQDVRKKVVEALMRRGKENDLDPSAPTNPGIIVAKDKDPKDIDGAVYLYVNEYTPEVGKRIKEKIRDHDPDYENTLFVVCGANGLKEGMSGNLLHMMYAANADGAMNAGYGTTSELHYLLENGFQGQLLLMPVEAQHEQEANAQKMKALLKNKITVADGESLLNQLDRLVQTRTKTSELTGDMSKLVTAVANPRTNVQHIVDLIKGDKMTEREIDLLNKGKKMAENPDTKAMRRLVKVIVPVLEAAMDNEPKSFFNIQVTAKGLFMPYNMRALMSAMKDEEKFYALLGLKDATVAGPETAELRTEFLDTLDQLIAHSGSPADQNRIAKDYAKKLGEHFELGY